VDGGVGTGTGDGGGGGIDGGGSGCGDGIEGTTGCGTGRSTVGGGVAHPARIRTAQQAARKADETMGWVLLEAGVALLLGIFIVWWLMRGKK
jgi:hypothetical protein